MGAAGLMRSSRSGVDSPSLGIGAGGSVQAVRRVGIAAPTFSLNVGVGPAGASSGLLNPRLDVEAADGTDQHHSGYPVFSRTGL